MDKEIWKYITVLNMAVLWLIGLAVHDYFRSNHIEWYWSHPILGAFVNAFGVSMWVVLVSWSSIYIYSKSKVKDHVQTC